MLTFYDRHGQAIAYLSDDGKSIYLYSGSPVAWLSKDSVYSYSGRFLGWLENDWIIDTTGHYAFFSEKSTGGPARPARQARPARGARGARPARGAREARPARPAKSISWSEISGEQFFAEE